MHIRKYDFDYGRRKLLEKVAKGVPAAGVLTSLWPLISQADTPDIQMVYPDELTSIEVHTKGKIKPGDMITAENVEHVEHLLDPIQQWQIKEDGRQMEVQETTTDITELFEDPYLEATLRNRGKHILDDDWNLWYEEKGKPARGGVPFPEPENAVQAQMNINFSWGRHNYSQYAIHQWDIGPDGETQYYYDFVWAELQATGRTDGKVLHDDPSKLRYQAVFFTKPNEQAGTAFMSTWHYDQSKFPGLIGYLPAFKRVREYPTNQRFEPLVPGATWYLSTAWAAGDPLATWGNYKIVERKPMLAAVRNNFAKDDPDWNPGRNGGPKGDKYWNRKVELVPECIVLECEPVHYPRAPIGKRVTWLDVRNGNFVASIDYDRKGNMWKEQTNGAGKYYGQKTGQGATPWSWCQYEIHDYQTNRISNPMQGKDTTGGYKSEWDTDSEAAYDRFFTAQALRRLGS